MLIANGLSGTSLVMLFLVSNMFVIRMRQPFQIAILCFVVCVAHELYEYVRLISANHLQLFHIASNVGLAMILL
jgi:hypothetical protein